MYTLCTRHGPVVSHSHGDFLQTEKHCKQTTPKFCNIWEAQYLESLSFGFGWCTLKSTEQNQHRLAGGCESDLSFGGGCSTCAHSLFCHRTPQIHYHTPYLHLSFMLDISNIYYPKIIHQAHPRRPTTASDPLQHRDVSNGTYSGSMTD